MSGKVLVTGASGFLGKKILSVFSTARETVGASNSREVPGGVKFDLSDPPAVSKSIADLKPELCIHCAATPDIDPCEKNPSNAERINVEGTFNLMAECWRKGVKFIYISTDYVFDGANPEGYSEDDMPKPLQVYGRTKLWGEKLVSAYKQALIVRVPFLYGFNDPGDKMTWPKQCAANLKEGKKFFAESTQVRQPTLIDDIAALLVRLSTQDVSGVLHLAAQEPSTKYEWACLIARELGKDPALITPMAAPTDETPRPLRAWLKVDKLKSLNLPVPRGVEEGTREVLRHL